MQAMPTSAATTAPSGPWAGFLQRGLRNQLLCALIALLIWLMTSDGRGSFLTAWIYSAAIGTLCWLFIDAGRLLLASWLPGRPHVSAHERSRWPGSGWMLVCVLVGTGLGYSLGSAVGDAITGFSTPSLLQHRGAVAISIITAVAATWYFYAKERLRAEQAAADVARREAAESQLMLLQSQLEPHMLFNTLANLRVLIALDPPRAQAMLDRLIGYLRATLGASRSTLHPLSAEFDRLGDYLELMALRMGPRLRVTLDLPESLRDLAVPPLLLQPLVENSIRHGLEPKIAGGCIEVRAEQRGNRLLLTVRDTGVGLTESAERLAGGGAPSARAAGPAGANSHYGTQHVADRLTTMYGNQARFTLAAAPGPDGGTVAELDLPLLQPQPTGLTPPPTSAPTTTR